jgi:hypothetical protein
MPILELDLFFSPQHFHQFQRLIHENSRPHDGLQDAQDPHPETIAVLDEKYRRADPEYGNKTLGLIQMKPLPGLKSGASALSTLC